MRYLQVVLFFGICHSILARGMQGNPAFFELESRLLRLEDRQFSERQNLEHKLLHLEAQLGSIELEPQIYALDGETATQILPSYDLKLFERLEKLEKNWEKDLEEQLGKFSSKYDNLAERFSVVENQIQEKQAVEKVLNILPKFKRIGKKFYLIENDKTLSWHGALAKCREMGASLVSLQNEEEWSAISDHLESDKSYWVDINDRSDEGVYVSESTGYKAPFLKWEAREPNHLTSENGSEDCVELRRDYDHYMNDIHCSAENYYICKK